MIVFLTKKLYFSLKKLGSIRVGESILKKHMYCSSIKMRQTFEVLLHDQKTDVWCATTAT
jgi:hypothetical protein